MAMVFKTDEALAAYSGSFLGRVKITEPTNEPDPETTPSVEESPAAP
jgi:hypothetical protein